MLKFATNVALNLFATNLTQLNWQGAAYHPVIFTAKDDDSVGQNVSGATGIPTGYYANPALSFNSFSLPTISHFRIAYAQQAISLNACDATFYDGQIVNCSNGVLSSSANASFRNICRVVWQQPSRSNWARPILTQRT